MMLGNISVDAAGLRTYNKLLEARNHFLIDKIWEVILVSGIFIYYIMV